MELNDPLSKHFRLGPKQLNALNNIKIITVGDLLFYFPTRYEEYLGEKNIAEVRPGERVALACTVLKIKSQKTWRTRVNLAEAILKDDTGLIRAVWFNQPYIVKMPPEGSAVRLTGKISENKNGLYLANPAFELADNKTTPMPHYGSQNKKLLAVYPETRGITSRWVRTHIEKIMNSVRSIPETLPEPVLKKYHLPKITTSLRAIHFPKNIGESEAARKRFSFEEIFVIQLARRMEKIDLAAEASFKIDVAPELLKDFKSCLPFQFTRAQEKALADILTDLKKPHPMARLLEGDVGSGKTVVAAGATLATAKAGYQTAFMAPTEILAMQHFEELSRRFAPFRIQVGLLTSNESRKFPSKINNSSSAKISKNQLLKWVASGEIKVLVGTHSLIEDRVKFKNLGFVVVDEQHRFGTKQRHKAASKNNRGPIPHFLSMSATPIPRTLALTMYGDLDLSLIDEMPPGRKPVETKIIQPCEREEIYGFIKKELQNGAQAFVVCPRIAEKEEENYPAQYPANIAFDWSGVKSVKQEYKKLAEEVFPEFKIGMVHGKMVPREKEIAIKQFRDGKTHVLVSTSVIEVGVDIPNASIMVIEGGERFGLATLHQFRGRVGRRGQKAYCFVLTTGAGDVDRRRLKALEGTKTGFELAEYDLQFRGPGELAGRRQWGISEIGIEAIKNIKMVEAARKEAEDFIKIDPRIEKYPLLKERVQKISELHLE